MTSAPPNTANLLDAYSVIRRRLQSDLDSLTRWIAAEQQAGRPITRARLLRQQRYRDLLTQVATEMQRYSGTIEQAVIEQATAAANRARTDAVDAIRSALGPGPPGVSLSFNRLPVGTINDITARLGPGQPLRGLLDSFGAEAAEKAREALITSVGLGIGPRKTAAAVKQALNVSAVRALTIARTEQLKAYRSSSLQTYQANSDVVKGWRWSCSLSTRTCAACWAMHGTVHPLDEPFASHPNCRCQATPITKTWAELGFTGIPDLPEPEPGSAVFARLSEAEQRQILGPGKLELFKAGKLELRDLVAVTNSRVWGKGRRERTLREVLSA